jgi:hypothetical protein
MKKIIKCTVILLSIFLLLGCKVNVDKFIEEENKNVEKYVAKKTKISKKKISESIDYILDNYNKKINSEYVYHTLLLKNITNNNYLKDSKIYELARTSDEYMLDQSDKNKQKLETTAEYIKKKEKDIVDEFYTSYENYYNSVINLTEAKTKLLVEIETKGAINAKKINKAIDFILLNYKNPFKNEEVLEKTIYYAMYLDTCGTKNRVSNEVIDLGKYMKKYIQELDESYIDKITTLKIKIKPNKDSLVNQIVNPPKKD